MSDQIPDSILSGQRLLGECSHPIVENSVCLECGWMMTSFDRKGGSDNGDFMRFHTEYVSVLEAEITSMNLDTEIRDSVIQSMRKLSMDTRQNGSRRQIMYIYIYLSHIELKKQFNYGRWIELYQSKRKDMTAPIKMAAGLTGCPVSNMMAEVVIISPIDEVHDVLNLLGIPEFEERICDLMRVCLLKNSDLYEENPRRTAIAFVKYYVTENRIKSVSHIAKICHVTPSVINSIIGKIRSTLSAIS